MDEGRELIGVVAGETLGVDELLPTPTRDLRDVVRGVTLALSSDLEEGVSSLIGAASLGVTPLALRTVRLVCETLLEGVEGARARRGVMGGFPFPFAAVRLLASVGFRGREWLGVLRSMGILQVVEWCQWRRRAPVQEQIMAVGGGNRAVAGVFVVVMVDCLVWCFSGGASEAVDKGSMAVEACVCVCVVTPR